MPWASQLPISTLKISADQKAGLSCAGADPAEHRVGVVGGDAEDLRYAIAGTLLGQEVREECETGTMREPIALERKILGERDRIRSIQVRVAVTELEVAVVLDAQTADQLSVEAAHMQQLGLALSSGG